MLRKICISFVVLWHGRTMRRNVWTDICELAKKKTEQLYKVSTPCIDHHHFKEEEMKSVGELSKVCSQIVLECLYLARIGRPDFLVVSEQTCTIDYKMDQSPVTNAWINWFHTFIIHVNTNNIVVNTVKQCRLGLFQDSDFAGDLKDSKSTSGGNIVRFWKSYICSNKLDVFETNFSFTQFNRIRNHLFGGNWLFQSLVTRLRTMIDGATSCLPWRKSRARPAISRECSLKRPNFRIKKLCWCVFEDNEAVNKMIVKGKKSHNETRSIGYQNQHADMTTKGKSFVCLTSAISVLHFVLKGCQKERKKNHLKKESQQNRSRWWIWLQGLPHLCHLLHTGILGPDEERKMLSRNELQESGTSLPYKKLLTMLNTKSFTNDFTWPTLRAVRFLQQGHLLSWLQRQIHPPSRHEARCARSYCWGGTRMGSTRRSFTCHFQSSCSQWSEGLHRIIPAYQQYLCQEKRFCQGNHPDHSCSHDLSKHWFSRRWFQWNSVTLSQPWQYQHYRWSGLLIVPSTPLWGPGSTPNDWADVCCFGKSTNMAPCSIPRQSSWFAFQWSELPSWDVASICSSNGNIRPQGTAS